MVGLFFWGVCFRKFSFSVISDGSRFGKAGRPITLDGGVLRERGEKTGGSKTWKYKKTEKKTEKSKKLKEEQKKCGDFRIVC